MSACRIAKQCRRTEDRPDVRDGILRRSVALHRLPVLREGLRGVRDASRRLDDQLRFRRPAGDDRHGGLRLLALRRSDLRAGLPGRRDQEVRRRHCRLVAQAALHRVLELRAGLPVRDSEADPGIRADDEVRHVLRPHVGGQAADVRHGLPQPGAGVRHAGDDRGDAAREAGQHVLVRQSEDHDEGLHDGAGGRGRHRRSTWPITCGRERSMWFRKPSSAPLWQDEFSVFTRRRALRQPPAVHQIPDPHQLRHVRGQSVDSGAVAGSTARRRIPAQAVAAAGEVAGRRREDCSSIRRPTIRASWCAPARIRTPPTARNARIFPARCITSRSRTGWSARAIRASSRSRTAPCCKVRRSGRCRASCCERRAAQLVAIRMEEKRHECRIRHKTAG